LAEESRRLKRSSFPWALSGILVVMLIVTLGAACDPATLRTTTAEWVVPHFAAAMGGGVWLVFSFWQQAACIRKNSAIVEQILKQVRTIRESRGLETDT
jgi:hypothetical protein